MNSMILGGCIPSPKKQTEPITVKKNPNMMYMLVGSYATPDEEGIKVYNFDEQTGNSQYISGIKGISNPSFLIPSADGKRKYTVGAVSYTHLVTSNDINIDFILDERARELAGEYVRWTDLKRTHTLVEYATKYNEDGIKESAMRCV